MKVILLGFFGLILGVLAGAVIGVGVGSACVEIFQVSKFEGGAGMMVFFTFMPIGAILGGIGGAIGFGYLGARSSGTAPKAE